MDQMDLIMMKTLNKGEEGIHKLLQYFYPKCTSVFPNEVDYEKLKEAMNKNKIILVGELHSREYHKYEKKILSLVSLEEKDKLYVGDESIEDAKDLAQSRDSKNYFYLWDLNEKNQNKMAAEKIKNIAKYNDSKIFVVVGESHVLALRCIQYYLIQDFIVPLLIILRQSQNNEFKIIKYSEYLYYIYNNFN